MNRLYELYMNKDEKIIKLKIVGEKSHWIKSIGNRFGVMFGGVRQWNDCYTFSHERKKLKQMAIETKEDWLFEAKANLEEIKNIKV